MTQQKAEAMEHGELTTDQRELLEDKFLLWDRASREGNMELRDYNRRAADALKAALALASQNAPQPINWDDFEDEIADAIADSFDMDWTARDGARAVVRALRTQDQGDQTNGS